MTAGQRLDQMVLEQMFHEPVSADENLGWLHAALVNDGLEVLPKAIKFVEAYDPSDLECPLRSEARLLTAVIYAHAIDASNIRLRSIERGRTFIHLLERTILRRRSLKDDGRNRVLEIHLKQMRGISIKDGLIRDSLAKQLRVKMSESEFRKFLEYLITEDPAYPGWSRIVGWAKMPKDEVHRYYKAYLKFKKSN